MLGFIQCISGSVCEVACMSLTFGEYDIDWQPNPLDAKSAIVGIDNLLQGTEQLPIGEGYGKFTPLTNTDFYTYDISGSLSRIEINSFPGAESYTNTIVGLQVDLNSNVPRAGFTQLYDNDLLSDTSMLQTALTDVMSNAETDIPVSMSVWVLATEADVQVGLMPLCYAGTLFASTSYSYVTAGKWTRLTRTIYIPAGVTIDNPVKLRIGGVLAIG